MKIRMFVKTILTHSFVKTTLSFPGVAGSPYNPQTPGAGLDTNVGSGIIGGAEWHTTDIEVRIRDSHQDPALAGQQGVIRGISVSILSLD